MNVSRNRDRGSTWTHGVAVCAIAASLVLPPPVEAQAGSSAMSMEPACRSLTPAAAGGPMPHSASVVVVRWMGVANMEVAYRDQVILLDAYYERPPRMHPIGVSREDLTRADALFIGHAHGDHVADAEYISERTGALVVGASVTIEHVQAMGVPEKKTRVVSGGEEIEFEGLSVRAVLGHHNVIPREYQAAITSARDLVTLEPPLTPDEEELMARIRTPRNRRSAHRSRRNHRVLLRVRRRLRHDVGRQPGTHDPSSGRARRSGRNHRPRPVSLYRGETWQSA